MNDEKAYSKAVLENLAKQVGAMFEKFDEKRDGQISELKAIQERIYGLSDGQNASWASNLELPDLWEQCQTMKAHIIDILYSHPEGLFDVTSVQPDKQEYAIMQKAMLSSAFDDMNLREQIEKITDNVIESGECTLFVGWETRKKAIRRQNAGNGYAVDYKTVFDGATVKTIAPQDFVFDSERVANWDSCPKIYRTYLDLDELKTNHCNTLLDDEIENSLLIGAISSTDGKTRKGFKEGLVEVLEFWGDVKLENGEILKNWLVVVAARQAVIRFEENPYVNSPFIYANLVKNPRTGRGVSPLKPILALNAVASNILNKQLDAYSLIVNPPYLAPKGAFKGAQAVSPGKIIEYDAALLPQSPVPLNFNNALCGWDFMQYFKGAIEATTGIYRTMGGSVANGNRTATELMQSANGQNARINLVIDSINRKIILPMVEKVADTIANFMSGKRTLTLALAGKKIPCVVDDEIRCADYTYRYSDRKASMERQWKQKELANTIVSFSKIPEFSSKINWKECFKFSLEQLGVENSEKFLTEGVSGEITNAAAFGEI